VAVAGGVVAVVEAHRVVAGHAVEADAAALVSLAGHTRADGVLGGDLLRRLEVVGYGHDLAGPLVADDGREGRRPEARELAGDDLGVRAADGHGFDAAEDFVALRFRGRHFLDLEIVRPFEDQCLHGLRDVSHSLSPLSRTRKTVSCR
jgi:hypothetical protein